MSFHKKIVLSFISFFIVTIFFTFIFNAKSDYYHTEIIYYDGTFTNKYHFRSYDAFLLIENTSEDQIYLQYKRFIYPIPSHDRVVFDVRGLSPIFIYKNKKEGMRSIINPYWKIIPQYFLENFNKNN